MAEEFTCAVHAKYHSVCEGLSEYQDTGYCVLHYRDWEKNKEEFLKVKKSKLAQEDYDFGGTVFPEGTSDFGGVDFDAGANFEGANFRGVASFRGARFRGMTTSFAGTEFSGRKTDFSGAEFVSSEGTHFARAQFSGKITDFSEAQFRGKSTSFLIARFRGESISFAGAQFFSSEETSFFKAEFKSAQTSFRGARFNDERTSFSEAQFSGEETSFAGVTFKGQPHFHDTTFRDATFENTTFQGGADFTGARFNGTRAKSNDTLERTTDFRRATFGGELYFRGAEFKGFADFYRTNFLDAAKFIGEERQEGPSPLFVPEGQVSFKRARIEKPELFSFDTLVLRPSWFVGVDAREFDFTAVQWYGLSNGSADTFNKAFDKEIKGVREKGETGSPYILLAQACRRLSANAEENRDYPLANKFHYWSMDALRKEGWRSLGLIGTLYWALSGYGVRAADALLVLVGICVVFAGLYMLLGPDALRVSSDSNIGQQLEHSGQAVVYSVSTMARLNPEPNPNPGLFQFLVAVEGILGPLQIALLALAIRRQVMR